MNPKVGRNAYGRITEKIARGSVTVDSAGYAPSMRRDYGKRKNWVRRRRERAFQRNGHKRYSREGLYQQYSLFGRFDAEGNR